MFFTFYYRRFSLILAMGFDIDEHFILEKVVITLITGLMRVSTVSRILFEN